MIDELDCSLRRQAAAVQRDLAAQDEAWGTSGWTRRRFLAGVGMAGVAALGTQLVTTRAAFASTPTGTERTLVVIFLRGAADGLRILQPMTDSLGLSYLRGVRSSLVLDNSAIALPGPSLGWGLNPALAPLTPYLGTNELAFVPAVSTPDLSRSHFSSQVLLEKGGNPGATDGWLNRVLAQLGPGTTFRAIAEGGDLPQSMLGPQTAVGLNSIDDFTFPAWDGLQQSSQQAVATLYRGFVGTLATDVPVTLNALATAAKVQADSGPRNGAQYPGGDFSDALGDVAKMLRTEVGMQVATVDIGGWDTHTDEANDLDDNLAYFAKSLNAFLTDLGPTRRSRVTVAVMTEFGRRVGMNASGGTDHGHGSVMWLLGGGLSRSGVFGRWTPLSDAVLDAGDVPGLNSPFAVLGEVAQKRLGVGSMSSIFPGQDVAPLGVATTL
ncbi:MAG: DUF1501 domain-containing protein [Jatrophihabitans sp.]|uniref:DUF1501 domain-containing protein n=1 Tax=Jatrophihabitans sp. TaxID=1932789 RepID=UPI003F7D0104